MINSIEIKETTWNPKTLQYEINYKTITRNEYLGDFNEFILENLNRVDVKCYAEEEFNMKEEGDCGCHIPAIDEFDVEDLVEELEEQGYKVIKCETLTDTFKLDQLKKIMELS